MQVQESLSVVSVGVAEAERERFMGLDRCRLALNDAVLRDVGDHLVEVGFRRFRVLEQSGEGDSELDGGHAKVHETEAGVFRCPTEYPHRSRVPSLLGMPRVGSLQLLHPAVDMAAAGFAVRELLGPIADFSGSDAGRIRVDRYR